MTVIAIYDYSGAMYSNAPGYSSSAMSYQNGGDPLGPPPMLKMNSNNGYTSWQRKPNTVPYWRTQEGRRYIELKEQKLTGYARIGFVNNIDLLVDRPADADEILNGY